MKQHSHPSGERKPALQIIGVHTASEGYPNTKYRLLALADRFAVTERVFPLLPESDGGVKFAKSLFKALARFAYVHARVLFHLFSFSPTPRAYVTYPAVPILWAYSLFPRAWRPGRIVADAFISLYDTVINDRKLVQADSLFARLLLRIEKRAYAVADCVVVDTSSNAEFYSRLFSLPLGKFVSAPLATNEIDYRFVPYEPGAGVCHVLFIGTLIPLHGVEAILGAAELLKGRPEIRFTIIGDGQEAPKIEAAMAAGLDNLAWTRAWMSSAELARAIAGADICLGVFGGGDKAQRVCPYKIYGYASVGRAVVTGSTDWLRAASADFGQVPFSSVTPMDSDALAAELVKLAADPDRRAAMARRSRLFYEEFLQNSKGDIVVEDCLMGRAPAGQHAQGMASN